MLQQRFLENIIETDFKVNIFIMYVGYSESKYRLRISLAHPWDCHFARVQWYPLSIEKPQICQVYGDKAMSDVMIR